MLTTSPLEECKKSCRVKSQKAWGGEKVCICMPPRDRGETNLFFSFRLNKFNECNVSSQATAWVKK